MQTQTNPGRILYTPDESVDLFLDVSVIQLRPDTFSISKADKLNTSESMSISAILRIIIATLNRSQAITVDEVLRKVKSLSLHSNFWRGCRQLSEGWN